MRLVCDQVRLTVHTMEINHHTKCLNILREHGRRKKTVNAHVLAFFECECHALDAERENVDRSECFQRRNGLSHFVQCRIAQQFHAFER